MQLSKIFLGANGLRAGWRLLIFLAVLISCLMGFREVVVQTPILTRMVEPLREGWLVVSGALISEIQFVLSLLVAVCVMGKIEKRSLGDYGVPGRDFLGQCFWQGVTWWLLAVTCLMLLISASGGLSVGGLALRGKSLAGYGVARLLALCNPTFCCFWFRSPRQPRRKLGWAGRRRLCLAYSSVLRYAELATCGSPWDSTLVLFPRDTCSILRFIIQ